MNNRRHFLAAAAAGSAAVFLPHSALAAVGRVIVVGGGMAGATAAKYLRLWSNKTIDVTLVEQSKSYTSNIMSNLVVTGQVPMGNLNFGYSKLVQKYGVKLLTASVEQVVKLGSVWEVTVRSATGVVSRIQAEHVVLAPGIVMDAVPETGVPGQAANILHAWIAGPQTDLLRQKLAAMPAGGTFVMSIPAKPYRCPPGPYERACVVADYLKRKKPNSQLIVLDANDGITAEPENFAYAFHTLYPNIIDYRPKTEVVSVRSSTGTVTVASTTAPSVTMDIASNVLNVIPRHRAGKIVQAVGLADASDPAKRFAQVNPATFESVAMPGLYVIGDAHMTAGTYGSGLPMAGHVGNQEAKICASAIIRAFAFDTLDPGVVTANSACFSPVSSTLASWLTAVYHLEPDANNVRKYTMHDYVSGTTGKATEAAAPSTKNFAKMNTWYKSLMAETYS